MSYNRNAPVPIQFDETLQPSLDAMQLISDLVHGDKALNVCKMSDHGRRLKNSIIDKYQLVQSCNEVVVRAYRGNHRVMVRFLQHRDRFSTTSNTRVVVGNLVFDAKDRNIQSVVHKAYQEKIRPWLELNSQSLQHPKVAMPVVLDSKTPVDVYLPAAFQIAHTAFTQKDSADVVYFANANKSLDFCIDAAAWNLAKPLETFEGHYIVFFKNGQYQLIDSFVFHKQFVDYRSITKQ